MWSKIKSWFGWVAGAVIGFLLLLLGMKNRKIKKQKEEIKDLETESVVKDVEIKATKTAQEVERKTTQETVEITQKAQEMVNDAMIGKISYNDVIEDWNNEKDN